MLPSLRISANLDLAYHKGPSIPLDGPGGRTRQIFWGPTAAEVMWTLYTAKDHWLWGMRRW